VLGLVLEITLLLMVSLTFSLFFPYFDENYDVYSAYLTGYCLNADTDATAMLPPTPIESLVIVFATQLADVE